MHAPNENAIPPRSALMKLAVRRFEYRRPGVFIGVRFASGLFNVGLGVVALSLGYWLGLLPLAGAAGLFWTAAHLYRSTQRQPAIAH